MEAKGCGRRRGRGLGRRLSGGEPGASQEGGLGGEGGTGTGGRQRDFTCDPLETFM